MLGIGIAAGAAIGPAPEASLAGSAGIAHELPALIAGVAARNRAQAPAQTAQTATASAPPAITPQTDACRELRLAGHDARAGTTTNPAPAPAESGTPSPTRSKSRTGSGSNVPPITSVWLVQLSGVSFAEALATPAAAPYITGQLLAKGTLLSGWSALDASGFASDAALVEHRATVGGAPPVLHSLVQPPCPEGAAGAACAASPGAADGGRRIPQGDAGDDHQHDDVLRTRPRRGHVRDRRQSHARRNFRPARRARR